MKKAFSVETNVKRRVCTTTQAKIKCNEYNKEHA